MTCRACHEPICGCPDPIYSGAVIDDQSEPGSWARHIRDTACMRSKVPLKVTHGGGEIIAPLEQ